MIERKLKVKSDFLHIPVHSGDANSFYYIEVLADGKLENEFLIGVCAPDENYDYYVAMDIKRYNCDEITLICRDEEAKSNLFDGIIEGGAIENEKELYPNLYQEEIRQQIHFSPKRGWLNDPNGLFYKDGVFHLYFQHNPFSNHHFNTNVSWGHALSKDGVHFDEIGDAIMPRDSKMHIASGSAIVDKYNISGLGETTVLAAYTDLRSRQWRGRMAVSKSGAQNLLYSKDDGLTFNYFENNPIIKVPDNLPENDIWRDPKILQLDEKTLCIAVYESIDGENCVSFYKSSDCKNWEFCSRSMDLYECPDLFSLKVTETDEELWVLYGGNGKYLIGKFEDFEFKAIGEGGFLDYGAAVYAGQTFNNFDDSYARRHMAWLLDRDHKWWYDNDEPNQEFGFSQAMSLMCNLSIHKTDNGYKLYRTPIDELKKLRQDSQEVIINNEFALPVPGETIFKMAGNKSFKLYVGNDGFSYDAENAEITTTSDKRYTLSTAENIEIRIYSDTRSVEIFIGNEISMSFFVKPKEDVLKIEVIDEIPATVYNLKSIWEKGE